MQEERGIKRAVKEHTSAAEREEAKAGSSVHSVNPFFYHIKKVIVDLKNIYFSLFRFRIFHIRIRYGCVPDLPAETDNANEDEKNQQHCTKDILCNEQVNRNIHAHLIVH